MNTDITSEAPVECQHFGRCGGCQFLDLVYATELARKQAFVEERLAVATTLRDLRVRPILAAAQPLFWRTTLKVPFGRRRGGAVAGFFERRSHDIVDLKTCRIQHPVLFDLLQAARALVRRCRVPIYDETTHTGVLRHLVGRVAAGSGEFLAGLVVREARHPAVRQVARGLWDRLQSNGLVGVVENVNAAKTNVIFGPTSETLFGRPQLHEVIDSVRVRTPLKVFAQANNTQAQVLYQEVERALGEVSGRRVADLYAGYGPIALRLAQRGATVHAVERDDLAVEAGKDAARQHGLEARLCFSVADVEQLLRTWREHELHAAVLDPPRRGLTPAVTAELLRLRIATLVYMSCNPTSLARDMAALAGIYRVESVQPIDLFPRTDHVEVVAVLRGT